MALPRAVRHKCFDGEYCQCAACSTALVCAQTAVLHASHVPCVLVRSCLQDAVQQCVALDSQGAELLAAREAAVGRALSALGDYSKVRQVTTHLCAVAHAACHQPTCTLVVLVTLSRPCMRCCAAASSLPRARH